MEAVEQSERFRPPSYSAAWWLALWLLESLRSSLERITSLKDLSITVARWLRDFLLNCTARVQITGERGDSPPRRQVLLQGAVLSSLISFLCIDDLRSGVPGTAKMSPSSAEKELQSAITAFAKWSISKKVILNADVGNCNWTWLFCLNCLKKYNVWNSCSTNL